MRSAVFVGLLLLSLAAVGFGDGIAYPEYRTVVKEAAPRFPSQRAVLKWDGQEETMLVQTTLAGPAGEYGWVVPLPHAPSFVKAVRPEYVEGTFAQVAPKIERLPPENLAWEAFGVFLLSALVLTAGYRYRRLETGYRVVCFLAEMLLLIVVLPIWFTVLGGGPAGAVMAAKSKSVSEDAKALNVQSLGTIGSYEVSVLSGPKGEEAYAWLKRHHIQVPDEGRAVMDQYAKEGWVFMAAELRKDGDQPLPPHPLKAVFPSTKLIYPMRLTATQDQPIFLELVVVADKRAEVDGMDAWSCRNDPVLVTMPQIEASQSEIFNEWRDSKYAMAKDQAVVTYLRGEIQPDGMRSDFDVRWKSYERYEPRVYDRSEARDHEGGLYLKSFIAFALVFGFIGLFTPGIAGKMGVAGAVGAALASIVVPLLWASGIRTVDTQDVRIAPMAEGHGSGANWRPGDP